MESNPFYGMKLWYIMLLKFPGWIHSLGLMREMGEIEREQQ